MSTIQIQPTIGLEDIQRAAFYTLFIGLNDVIPQVEEYWSSKDEFFNELTGQTGTTTLDLIAPENFHEGHRPSLVDRNATISKYPNVCVVAVSADPSPEDTLLDQTSSYLDVLYVEIMVKSETSEQEVGRRIHRTVEAVNLCLLTDQTLGGVIGGFEMAPSVEISEVFTRSERTSYGPEWFWQAARITYAVRKVAELPTPSGENQSIFEIDQA